MARYYFDLHDGDVTVDDVGVDCTDIDAVRREAKRTLPELAREILFDDGEHQTVRVIVRDEEDDVVYTATLIYNGQATEKRVK